MIFKGKNLEVFIILPDCLENRGRLINMLNESSFLLQGSYSPVYKTHLSSFSLFGDPMDGRPASSSVRGLSQAGILEWVAISFSR